VEGGEQQQAVGERDVAEEPGFEQKLVGVVKIQNMAGADQLGERIGPGLLRRAEVAANLGESGETVVERGARAHDMRQESGAGSEDGSEGFNVKVRESGGLGFGNGGEGARLGPESQIPADGGNALEGHLAPGGGQAARDDAGQPPAEDAAERDGEKEGGEGEVKESDRKGEA